MTVRNKTAIKAFFETGDRPTQAQFSDMIESYQDTSYAGDAVLTLVSGATGLIEIQGSANATAYPMSVPVRNLIRASTSASAASAIGAVLAGATAFSTGVSGGLQSFDADTLKADTSDDLTVGYTATAHNGGTISSGTYTPAPANGNFQRYVNGGAHTLAPPSATGDYTIVIQITNNGSAGSITTSGFTKVSGSFATTNGDDFLCYITKLNGFTYLSIVALQ